MSWWSKTIMGGDLPFELFGIFLYDICNLPANVYHYGESLTTARTNIQQNIPLIVSHIENVYHHTEVEDDIYNIAYQVLGYIAVESGAILPQTIHQHVIKCFQNDLWAQTDNERLEYLDRYVNVLSQHQLALHDREILADWLPEHMENG